MRRFHNDAQLAEACGSSESGKLVKSRGRAHRLYKNAPRSNKRRVVETFPPNEQGRLVRYAVTEPDWALAIVLDLDSGMREGEFLALRPEDFDFDRRLVQVQRTRAQVPYRRFHAIRHTCATSLLKAGCYLSAASKQPTSRAIRRSWRCRSRERSVNGSRSRPRVPGMIPR
jgi:integrase